MSLETKEFGYGAIRSLIILANCYFSKSDIKRMPIVHKLNGRRHEILGGLGRPQRDEAVALSG